VTGLTATKRPRSIVAAEETACSFLQTLFERKRRFRVSSFAIRE
jgi:hypothetical protein